MATAITFKKSFSELLKDKNPSLWSTLEEIKKRGMDLWVPMLSIDRGSHSGYPHLRSVEENANRIVPDFMKDSFSDGEIFLLLASIFLHDIGRIEGNKDHHISSYKLIISHWSEWGLPDERISEYCALIAFYHGVDEPEIEQEKPFTGLRKIRTENPPGLRLKKYGSVSLFPYGTLRIPLLSAILRIADETDSHWKRAIRAFIVEHNSDRSEELLKWFRRFIEDVEFCYEGECILLHIPPVKISGEGVEHKESSFAIKRREQEILNNTRRDIAKVLRNWKSILSEYDLKYRNVFFDFNNNLLTELTPGCENKPKERLVSALENARREYTYPYAPVILYYFIERIAKVKNSAKVNFEVRKGELYNVSLRNKDIQKSYFLLLQGKVHLAYQIYLETKSKCAQFRNEDEKNLYNEDGFIAAFVGYVLDVPGQPYEKYLQGFLGISKLKGLINSSADPLGKLEHAIRLVETGKFPVKKNRILVKSGIKRLVQLVKGFKEKFACGIEDLYDTKTDIATIVEIKKMLFADPGFDIEIFFQLFPDQKFNELSEDEIKACILAVKYTISSTDVYILSDAMDESLDSSKMGATKFTWVNYVTEMKKRPDTITPGYKYKQAMLFKACKKNHKIKLDIFRDLLELKKFRELLEQIRSERKKKLNVQSHISNILYQMLRQYVAVENLREKEKYLEHYQPIIRKLNNKRSIDNKVFSFIDQHKTAISYFFFEEDNMAHFLIKELVGTFASKFKMETKSITIPSGNNSKEAYSVLFALFRRLYDAREGIVKDVSIGKSRSDWKNRDGLFESYRFEIQDSNKEPKAEVRELTEAIISLFVGSLGHEKFTWEALEARTGEKLNQRSKWLLQRINLASEHWQVDFHEDNHIHIKIGKGKIKEIYKDLGVVTWKNTNS